MNPIKDSNSLDLSHQDIVDPDASLSFKNIFKDAKRQTIRLLLRFFLVLISFGILNSIFVLLFSIKYWDDISKNTILYIIVSVFIGFLFTALAVYLTYKFILIDTLKVIYKYLTPFFKKLSSTIVEKVTSGRFNIKESKSVDKSLLIGNLFIDVYGSKIPRLIQKAIMFVLRKLPFSEFFIKLQNNPNKHDKSELSTGLYNQINIYIVSTIFRQNVISWLLVLLILNIILQVLLLYII